MRSAVSSEPLRCSTSFVRPFLDVLANGQPIDDEVWKGLGIDGEAKLPVAKAYELLSTVIEQTKDVQLGLKAGARMDPGDTGALDYLMQTAPTVGAAAEVAVRYLVLLNESLTCRLELQEDVAVLRLDSCIPQPPAAEDFMLSSLVHSQVWLREIEGLECWFVHPVPEDREPYARVFGDRKLRFGADHSAFVFPRDQLRRALPGADPKLHAVVRELADILLAEHACRAESFAERVRTVLATEVSTQSLSAAAVARRLQTSGRTLARKLGAEGTSFYALLDDARRVRALQLIADNGRTLSEIASATGFAHVASFHRAFRRWTGQTPADYRTRSMMLQ